MSVSIFAIWWWWACREKLGNHCCFAPLHPPWPDSGSATAYGWCMGIICWIVHTWEDKRWLKALLFASRGEACIPTTSGLTVLLFGLCFWIQPQPQPLDFILKYLFIKRKPYFYDLYRLSVAAHEPGPNTWHLLINEKQRTSEEAYNTRNSRFNILSKATYSKAMTLTTAPPLRGTHWKHASAVNKPM